MSRPNPVFYPLGSRRRWIESLLLLFGHFLIVQISIFLVMLSRDQDWASAASMTILLSASLFIPIIVPIYFTSSTDENAPLLNNTVLNLAYGRVNENGIYYREWFRDRFVSWKGVARLEFWPESEGRVVLHLYSQLSPVVFIPDSSRESLPEQDESQALSTVDFISQKLNETWPGKAPFLICLESPKKYKGINGLLEKLNVRQRAIANAVITLVLLSACLTYGFFVPVEINRIVRYTFWAVAFLFIVWARITGRSRTGTVSKNGMQKAALPPGS